MAGRSERLEAIPRRLGRDDAAGFLLGFALSGFFDGILLHQVLQWHHLLSLTSLAPDLEAQITADGLFHTVMYFFALGGLIMLWQARGQLDRPGAGTGLLASVLVGFGCWNVLDIAGVHWAAGLHRVRVDVADPLPWDIGWFIAFGLAPIVVARMLHRGQSGPNGRKAAALLSLLALGAAGASVSPTSGGPLTGVVFRPGMTSAAAWAAVVSLDAQVAWMSDGGRAAVVILPPDVSRWRLYRAGALFVGGTATGGCSSWIREANATSS